MDCYYNPDRPKKSFVLVLVLVKNGDEPFGKDFDTEAYAGYNRKEFRNKSTTSLLVAVG